jgi:hypothetical protein
MSNYNIRLNLAKFKKTTIMDIQGKSGKVKCVVIPIEENGIYVSDKTGNIFLDVSAYAQREIHYGQTHAIKQKIGGDKWRNMTQEERKAIPICGNMTPIEVGNGGNYQDNTTQPSTSQSSSNFGSYNNSSNDDNLPF